MQPNFSIVDVLNQLVQGKFFVTSIHNIDHSELNLRVEIKVENVKKLMIKIISVTDIGLENVRVVMRDSNDLLMAIEPLGVSENRKYEYWVNIPTLGIGVKIEFVL